MSTSTRLWFTLILIVISVSGSFASASLSLFAESQRYHTSYSLIPDAAIQAISSNLATFSLLSLTPLIIGVIRKSRAALTVSAVFYSIFSAYLYAHFDAPVPWGYLLVPLWGFALFWRKDDKLLLDLIRWSIAWTYFSSGIAKIVPLSTFGDWLSGGTIQGLAYDRYIHSPLYFLDLPPFFDYSGNNNAWLIFAIASVLIELSAAIMFLTRRFDVLMFLLLIGFHASLILFGVSGFLEQFLCVALFTMTRKGDN